MKLAAADRSAKFEILRKTRYESSQVDTREEPCKRMQKKGLDTSNISFSLQKHLLNQYNYWLLRVKSSRESVLNSINSVNSALGMQLENEILAKMPASAPNPATMVKETFHDSLTEKYEAAGNDQETLESADEQGILLMMHSREARVLRYFAFSFF